MPAQYGDMQIRWLGHDGFLLEGSKRIYIDPYQIEPRDKPSADYLLITHSHYDHLSVPDIEHLIGPNTIVLCPTDCASKLTKFKMKMLKPLTPGESFDDDAVHILAVPAYNIEKTFHPRENDWLGYVVTLDGAVIYHTGDTDYIPEMDDITCNIALLPVSGTYVMSAEEAAYAANKIKPDVAIPMHWGNLIGSHEDAEKFKKLAKCDVVILERE